MLSKIDGILNGLIVDIQQIDWSVDNSMSFQDSLIENSKSELRKVIELYYTPKNKNAEEIWE